MSDRADHERPRLEPLAALGEAIRALRTESGLSQSDLAERAQIEPALIDAVEGGSSEPTWGDLRRIAYALDTPLAGLLELAETLETGDSV